MPHTKYQISTPSRFREKKTEDGLLCSYIPTCDPQGGASFDPRGIIWTNLVEVFKEMLYTKYQSSRPFSFGEEFWNFLSLFLCSNLWPLGQAQFWPQGHHINKFGRSPLGHATYQILKLCTFQFQKRRFLKFSFFVPMFQTCDPRRGANFDPRAIIWTILVEVH